MFGYLLWVKCISPTKGKVRKETFIKNAVKQFCCREIGFSYTFDHLISATLNIRCRLRFSVPFYVEKMTDLKFILF